MARNNYKSGIDFAIDHLVNATDELVIEAEHALIDTKAKEVIYKIEKIENYLTLVKQIINEKKYTLEDSTIKLDEKGYKNYALEYDEHYDMTVEELLNIIKNSITNREIGTAFKRIESRGLEVAAHDVRGANGLYDLILKRINHYDPEGRIREVADRDGYCWLTYVYEIFDELVGRWTAQTKNLDEHIIQLDATYSEDLLNYFLHEIPDEPMTIRQLLEFGLADIVLDGETIAYEEDLIVEVDISFGPIGNVVGYVTNIVGDINLDTAKASINESTLNENEALYQFDLTYVDEVVNNVYYEEPGDIPRETVVLDLLKDAKRAGLKIVADRDLVNNDIIAVGTKEQFREFERTNQDVLDMKTPGYPYWIDEFGEEAWELTDRDLELTTFIDIDKEIRNLERQVK